MARNGRNGQRGLRWEIGLFRRWLRLQQFRLSPVLTPRQIQQLAWTHLIIRPLERYTHYHVAHYCSTMPRVFEARGVHLATVILGVGFGQKPAHAYWVARRLSQSWHCRVLVLRTPVDGNVDSHGSHAFFHRVALMNQRWVAEELQSDYAAGVPIVGLGFSKGGQDMTVLAKLLLDFHGLLLDDIITLSTPWQGSRLWRQSPLAGAEQFKPGSAALLEIEELGQSLYHDWGIRFHFFTAWKFDQIVHPSDARFRRLKEDIGISVDELRNRWYFARPLWLQLGHTALFNGLVNLQMGLEIQRIVRGHSLPAVRHQAAAHAAASIQDEED